MNGFYIFISFKQTTLRKSPEGLKNEGGLYKDLIELMVTVKVDPIPSSNTGATT